MRLLCLIVIMGTFSKLDAQEFRFGFHMSPFYSWMVSSDNTIDSGKGRFGLTIASLGEYYVGDNYAIISGVGLSFGHGGSLEHTYGGVLLPESELSNEVFRTLNNGVEITYKLQSVEVPIGLKMLTNDIEGFNFYAEIPVITMGFRTNARVDINDPQFGRTDDEEVKPDVGLFNLSWGLGFGAEKRSGDTALLIGLAFQRGFVDLTNDNATQNVTNEAGVITETRQEDSKGAIGRLTLKLGVIF